MGDEGQGGPPQGWPHRMTFPATLVIAAVQNRGAAYAKMFINALWKHANDDLFGSGPSAVITLNDIVEAEGDLDTFDGADELLAEALAEYATFKPIVTPFAVFKADNTE